MEAPKDTALGAKSNAALAKLLEPISTAPPKPQDLKLTEVNINNNFFKYRNCRVNLDYRNLRRR